MSQMQLLTAAKNGEMTVVKSLIEKGGANLNQQVKDDVSALMWAAERGHQDIVKQLIEKVTDIHIQAKEGDIALFCAATNGHENIVKYLTYFSQTLLKTIETTFFWILYSIYCSQVTYL